MVVSRWYFSRLFRHFWKLNSVVISPCSVLRQYKSWNVITAPICAPGTFLIVFNILFTYLFHYNRSKFNTKNIQLELIWGLLPEQDEEKKLSRRESGNCLTGKFPRRTRSRVLRLFLTGWHGMSESFYCALTYNDHCLCFEYNKGTKKRKKKSYPIWC